jgi:hypothetical protein
MFDNFDKDETRQIWNETHLTDNGSENSRQTFHIKPSRNGIKKAKKLWESGLKHGECPLGKGLEQSSDVKQLTVYWSQGCWQRNR